VILHVTKAIVCGPHSLDLTFSDGMQKRLNLFPLLNGPIFQPLKDPDFFAKVSVDPVIGTVVWPNGADIAPEALHEMQSEQAA
jgi:hypothetical protein